MKQLRSYLGEVNQMNKFVPDLALKCAPFRPLLKQDGEWKWEETHEKAFQCVNQSIREITELAHFNRNLPLRILCDASKDGLGTVLQQFENEQWLPISFASRFLTNFESKYSINELELLAVVWSIEYFRNYVYGTKFEVISDHKALMNVLKNNRGNKTYSSRLTRWVDRLLPFEFDVVQVPRRTLGLVDYMSRHPSELEGDKVKAEALWHDWFTVNVVSEIKPFSDKRRTRTESTNGE